MKGIVVTDEELLLLEPWSIPKPQHGSVEWLRARKWRNGEVLVSASDCAAVHGEHRFKSMAQLAIDLLDTADPVPSVPNAAMERGNKLEPVLLHWASEELGQQVKSPDRLFGYGRLVATLDGLTVGGDIVECKTTVRRFDGRLPRYWHWQGVQQALCHGGNRVLWVVLDGDLNLTMTEQFVTQDDMLDHLRAVDRFLAAIDMGMLPAEAVPTVEDIARLNPEPSPVPAELPESAAELFDWYHTVDAQAKQAKEELEKCKGEIAALLGASEVGLLGGREAVSWKMSSRRSFDSARFEAEHPELAAQFMKTTKFRTMRVKAGK
jgi:predicted phage-related endonuclease